MSAHGTLRGDAEGAARSIARLLAEAEQRLRPASATARLDAEVLLAATSSSSRAALIAFPERVVTLDCAARFRSAVGRRARGEPLAYLTGIKEFYSLTLRVTPAVLIPRAETELLVDAALARLDARKASAVVLELGTGSGAIALAIKRHRPLATVTAVDREAAALAVARDNARRLELDVAFVASDWFSALRGERFDLIVVNPPYVASSDPHFAGALAFEPRAALDGGADGLDACRAIFACAASHLTAEGRLLLEHGYDQRGALLELASAHGFVPDALHEDLAGIPRVAIFKASGP